MCSPGWLAQLTINIAQNISAGGQIDLGHLQPSENTCGIALPRWRAASCFSTRCRRLGYCFSSSDIGIALKPSAFEVKRGSVDLKVFDKQLHQVAVVLQPGFELGVTEIGFIESRVHQQHGLFQSSGQYRQFAALAMGMQGLRQQAARFFDFDARLFVQCLLFHRGQFPGK